MRHKLRKLPKVGCILVIVTLYSFTHNFSHHFALLAPFPNTATDGSSNTNYYELSLPAAVTAAGQEEEEEAVTPPRPRPHHHDDNNNNITKRIKHYYTDISTAGGVKDKQNKKDKNVDVAVAAAAPSTAANRPPPGSITAEEQDSMQYKNHSSSSSSTTTTTTTTTRDVSTGRISSYNVYACGYPDFADKVASSLFNDAKKIQWFTEDHLGADNHSPNDILVASFRGPCFLHRPGRKTTIPKKFRGRVLYITGEPLPLYPLDVRDGLYALSHMPTDGKQNIRCYYGPMDLSMRASPMLQKKIFDPDKKMLNSGERFLIYANTKCKSFRESAFDSLSYVGRGPAYYGGGCNGTMDRSDTVQFDSKVNSVKWGNNHKAFSKYRFALVMENTKKHGYVTEKILNAFLAGSVPIYYGTRDVFRIFNPKAFVYYDIEDPKPALDLISYLERNETAYNDMLRNQPILKDGENTIQEYFSYSDEIGNGILKKKIRAMMGFETHIHTHTQR